MNRTGIMTFAAVLALSSTAFAQSTVEVKKDGEQMRPAQTVPASPATGAAQTPTAEQIKAAAMKEKGEQMRPK